MDLAPAAHSCAGAERGQATLELLGVLPFLALAALACVQALLVGLTAIFLQAGGSWISHERAETGSVPAVSGLPMPHAWRSQARLRELDSGSVELRLATPVVVPGVDQRTFSMTQQVQQ